MIQKELIQYLSEAYKTAQKTGVKAINLEIDYTIKNHTYWMEINGKQYSLNKNQLSDKPDGVESELTKKINLWVTASRF